jgi:hypothetical protein
MYWVAGVGWVHVVRNWVYMWAVVLTVFNNRIPLKVDSFFKLLSEIEW